MVSPSLAEADVGKTDGTPGEEGSKTRQRNEPVEDLLTGSADLHVAENTPGKNEYDGEQWATGAIHVGEDLRSIALFSESSQRAGTTVDTRDTDGNDGDKNDNVHETVESFKTTVASSNNERRGVGTLRTEKIWIVRANEKTDECKTKNVKEGDTPENLTNSTRKRLERVLGLSSGETDKLGTREGKGSSDEYCAETLEPVSECTGVVPKSGTPVLIVLTVVRTATKNEDQGNDHEDDCCGQLQARRPEFFFGISQGTKDVDYDDENPEDGNPDT